MPSIAPVAVNGGPGHSLNSYCPLTSNCNLGKLPVPIRPEVHLKGDPPPTWTDEQCTSPAGSELRWGHHISSFDTMDVESLPSGVSLPPDGHMHFHHVENMDKSPAVIVADNVLKPGAPIFLWRVTRDAQFQTEIHPVTEFAMPAKDWMSVSTFRPPVPPVPPELLELDRMADDMRIQAMRCSRSVPYQDWADFAELMEKRLDDHGIGPGHDCR
eukprot:s97_g31.t1